MPTVCPVIVAETSVPSPCPNPPTLLKGQQEGILLTAEMLRSEGIAPASVGRSGVSTVRRRRKRLAWGPEGGGCVEGVRMAKGRDRGLEQGVL